MPPKDKLPQEIDGHDTYYNIISNTLSLACRGRIIVRAVYKNIDLAGACPSSSGPRLMPPESGAKIVTDVVRCELELPAGSGDEASRAVRAKEAKCWRCPKGMCPNKVGVWYSEVYTMSVQGCDQKIDPKFGYDPLKVGMLVNPSQKVLVAKYEACSDPGCFDQAHEDKKYKDASSPGKRTC
eukprot:GHUV01015613.1.p1 GENE.GHUV01015613.1~~GHUV01015613.1.p1  ORF type:complete len:182 (+),score=50.30 GHUV01015613.1:1256-1801(+)